MPAHPHPALRATFSRREKEHPFIATSRADQPKAVTTPDERTGNGGENPERLPIIHRA
jgi:hypothetical protein